MKEISDQDLFYQIALTQIEGIGSIYAKRLIQHFGNPESIFKASHKELANIEGLGSIKINAIKKPIDEKKVVKELAFIRKNEILPVFITNEHYPTRLKDCNDAPLLIFTKGNQTLNPEKTIAIIGTRKNTDYGTKITEELIEQLKDINITVISGLAHGIDTIAHRKALQCSLPTFAVLAHSLDRIYPTANGQLAKDICKNGLLVTEYPSGTKPDKQNFPMRNRIVAGLADITIVVETDIKGGAMITAKLAAGYNRDVVAFPGRTSDNKSKGCNDLIKQNIAQMITCADDVLNLMNWQKQSNKKSVQATLFNTLSDNELKIVNVLKEVESLYIDELMLKTALSNTTLASLLLKLEFDNIVKSLPGKRYRLY